MRYECVVIGSCRGGSTAVSGLDFVSEVVASKGYVSMQDGNLHEPIDSAALAVLAIESGRVVQVRNKLFRLRQRG